MTPSELTAALSSELPKQRRTIRRHATPERLERAARLVAERMESGVAAAPGGDASSPSPDETDLINSAIAGEPVSGIGVATVALWILQAVFSWAVRRAIQIWRERQRTQP